MAVTDPRSRNEEILRATIDGTEYVAPPRSRIEDLLIELKEAIEQGGGGGGGDVTGVKGSAESTYRKGNVNLTAENIGVEAGAEVNTIESITLNGDVVTPDANKNVALVVITNTVNNLVNYYLKTETYSKSEVDAIAALLKNGRFISVNELPTTDIDQSAIYLVPKSSAQTNNVKDEYINLDGTSAGWELIGDTQIDLSNYVTTSQLTTALADYTTTTALTTLLADKVDKVSGKGLSTNDYDNTEKQKVADAQPKTLATPIEVEGVEQTTVEGALGAINNKSGTGGTSNYNELSNKPQITGVTLSGNKSLADLGIQPAESGKGLSTNDYDNTAKGIVDGVTAALANKVDKESGKGLSTNDYTSAEKAKLESLTRVQYDVMPTASGARVGMVVQYIGATNANYTHNYVYECVDNSGSYAWERKDVQPSEGGGHTIENASGTALTQRDTLQFKGGLSVSDDSTNEKTVVELDKASANDLGGVKVGSGLSIDNDGVLSATGGGGSSERRTRQDITTKLANLPQAVSEQDLAKYGYSIGDYFTGASGYTYVIADYNTFKGTLTPYCLTDNHIGIVVDTHATSQWHSGSAQSVGYAGSVLHSYLSGTVLNNIKSDMIALFGGSTGLEHLYSHSKLFTTALANWAWSADQYISALTCTQVDAGSQWTANGFQEGEASKSLEVFRKYKWTEIFGNEYPWLRNISNYDNAASYACYVNHGGLLDGFNGVTDATFAVGLILFH